ncbi:apolipoprotein N-acyltransferase [Polaribacter sp.]|uniref:apolipoprotein N-acyltransferase n=1 Tax=Polaribacter sp. TaxID=1920175 RepID=UPI0040481D0E
MKVLKKIPLWLQTGILYGFSWPIFEGVNLSYLAWFAFVPLFIFLEKNKHNFIKSMLCSFSAMVVFEMIAAGWLFNFPVNTVKILLMFLLEDIWFFFPFFLFFFIQKKLTFQKAIWLFPIIWMVWEWVYLDLEFTMGTHISAYSQSSNLWLIQYLDITGMWGVSFWLMLFNVLIFKAYKESNEKIFAEKFLKKVSYICLIMLGIPFIYGIFSFIKYDSIIGKKINVTVIPTHFSDKVLMNAENVYTIIDKTLYKSDSMAFTMSDKGICSDLFVWPESGLTISLQESNIESVLFEAVNDWKSALITGGRNTKDTINIDNQAQYVSGILISHKQNKPIHHYKTILSPGQEAIPYHSLLSKIPGFPIKENDPRFFLKGSESKPLPLITKNNNLFNVGVSLCFEQWYPKHWAKLSENGADFYTHLAAEGWYGNVGFMAFMANVSRMRSIENRKQTARSANVGISCFIDQFGRYQKNNNENTYKPIHTTMTAQQNITFYAKYPNLFPAIGIFMLITLFLKQFINI